MVRPVISQCILSQQTVLLYQWEANSEMCWFDINKEVHLPHTKPFQDPWACLAYVYIPSRTIVQPFR